MTLSWTQSTFLPSCNRKVALFSIFLLTINTVGHGMSDGHRVHVESIDDYVNDILNHIQLMREEHPQIPIFAVGHSMVSLFFFFFPHRRQLEKSMKWFVVFSCLFIGWYDSPIGCIERAIGIRWCRLDGTTDSHRSSPCLTRQTLGCQNTQPCHSSPCGINLFYVFYF